MCPLSPADLAEALAASLVDSVGPNRTLTLSRYTPLVEAANQPRLREHLASAGARVSAYFINWLRLIGSTDPDRHFHMVGNYIIGLVLHQLNRDQVWQAIDEQRLGLVELPEGLSEPDWSHLSLRDRWT
jgi:tetracycline repressor-like protein